MSVTEMLTSIAVMAAAVRIRVPLMVFMRMGVMRLVKARLIIRISHALHGYEEHSHNHRVENYITHPSSLQTFGLHIQKQFTYLLDFGKEIGVWNNRRKPPEVRMRLRILGKPTGLSWLLLSDVTR